VVAAIVPLCGSSILTPAQGDPLPKIGYLGFGAATPPTFFQKRMRELGYSEGKDVEVEYRFADGRPEKLPALARELLDAKVNVIVAIGDEAIVAAKNATRTIPIAMVACEAVTSGFVASLARPGGNLTGVTCLTSELMPKRMGLFRELLPSASRVVVLFNPENVSKPPEATRTVELAKELGLDAKAVQFRTAEDIERAFSAFAGDRPDGLIVLTEQRSMLHAWPSVTLRISPPCRSSVTYLSTGSSRLSSPSRTARANSVASNTLPSEARLNNESEVSGRFVA